MSKSFRIFNYVFAALCVAYGLGFGIYVIIVANYTRLFACGGLVLLCVAPFILEKICRFKVSNFVLIIYLAYVLLACGFGSMLGAYSKLAHLYYDKVIHGLFGYVGSIGALYLICKLGEYNTMRGFTIGLMCFGVAMAAGAVWEIYEYCGSIFFGMHTQGSPDALGNIPVTDTMGDIIANTLGSMIFTIQFILHKTTKKNFLISSMVKEFQISYKKNQKGNNNISTN